MSTSKIRRSMYAMFALGLVATACGDDGTADEAGEGARPEIATLDVDALEAETDAGAVEAQRAELSYVSSVGDGRAIGVMPLPEEQQEEHGDIAIFVYDGDRAVGMTGDLDSSGAATLEADDDSDFESTVELIATDNEVSGTATFVSEEPTSFTAPLATGRAGVYGAVTGPDGGSESGPGVWVVLDDGKQWGFYCFDPINYSEFCIFRR